MHLSKVEISDFRNLISASFIPCSSLNVISGSNGSGKSSLLEALYFIANGRSFRSNRLGNIINKESRCFTLFGETGDAVSHRIGIRRCNDNESITRVDGRDLARRSDLIHLLPMQVISPESIELLTEGSERRRSFMDWGLFHVEHAYHHHLSHYLRALKQRNSLLKQGRRDELLHWNPIIEEEGNKLSVMRRKYIADLEPDIRILLQELLPEIEIAFQYQQGWNKEQSLQEALSLSVENDLRLKYSTVGPHRADLQVKSEGTRVSDTLSRGQLKLVAIAMLLAQIITIHRDTEKRPIILVDDIAAELDAEHRQVLLESLFKLDTQLFVTTPDSQLVDHQRWLQKKMFHVEHGGLKEVV